MEIKAGQKVRVLGGLRENHSYPTDEKGVGVVCTREIIKAEGEIVTVKMVDTIDGSFITEELVNACVHLWLTRDMVEEVTE